ncbi:NUDIX hydrolase [Streptomyces fragilis]|uniref:NUDIX hydrolase n=1 Tax=Streptomyces fragilis TaxID=67301 RepID=A0ABV2YNE6_9ACTN|nr:NUDIX hydrolase [Streptomyces fragilis]
MTVTQPTAGAAGLSEYLAVHPAPVMAADALIRDGSGRVLIVDPSYKEGWDLPGGMVDDEEPVAALERELREELGIRGARVGRLLAVDSMPKEVYGRAHVACVYAVHPRRPPALEELVLQREELLAAEYVTEREALRRLPEPLRRRVRAALRASLGSHTAQLRQGRPVPVDLKDHYALLPSPMMAAAALITDTRGRVLVAEHSYDHGGGSPFGLPGGMVHAQESPRRGAARELAEELGLTGVPVGRLVAVDSTPARTYGRALDVHVFTVGPLTDDQVAAIGFPDGEILAVHWLAPEEALAVLPAQIGNRLRYGLRALAAGTVAHLEGGLPQPGSAVGLPPARRAPLEEGGAGPAAAADRLATRAKALTTVAVLLTDPAGRVVLAREGESGWSLPSAPVAGDTGETPRPAARRVLRERLGRDVPPGALLAVDWVPGAASGCEGARVLPETLHVYDGGVLLEAEAAADGAWAGAAVGREWADAAAGTGGAAGTAGTASAIGAIGTAETEGTTESCAPGATRAAEADRVRGACDVAGTTDAGAPGATRTADTARVTSAGDAAGTADAEGTTDSCAPEATRTADTARVTGAVDTSGVDGAVGTEAAPHAGAAAEATGAGGPRGGSGAVGLLAVPLERLETVLPAADAARVRECLVVRECGTGAVELVAGRPARG